MSAKEPGLAAASCYSEDENDKDEEVTEAQEQKSQRSSSDESDESEPELSLASRVRRKVSFADAFGLDLVSVKEFDSRVGTGSEGLEQLLGRETIEGEEFYLLCIFNIPASDEELHFHLHRNKLELESIELLPGSTTIRGIIRVLNLSYHKTIYVHTTFDSWQSSFDILAEFVPGSSDGETDRFSFQLNLEPPFGAAGVRVEFCLCYESSVGTFWASNGGMNYVLFCHQREGRALKGKSEAKEKETEENNYKGKKSCLKAVRKSSTEGKSTVESSDLSEPESLKSEESEKEKAQHKTKSPARCSQEESGKLLAARRSRRRATRLSCMQDYFSHRESESQLDHLKDRKRIKDGLKVVLPAPEHIQVMIQDTSPILDDHQIHLLSLDWGKCTPFSQTHDPKVSNGTRPSVAEQQTKDESTESSDDAWEAFLKGSDSSDNHANCSDKECLTCIAKSNVLQPLNTKYDTLNSLSEWSATEDTKEFPLAGGTGSPQCIRLDVTLDSNPAELLQVFNPNHVTEVLGYEYTKRTGHIFVTDTLQESELPRIQWRAEEPCVSKASHDGHTSGIMSFREDGSLPLANPGETARTSVPANSHAGDEVLLEKCATSPGTEEEVNGDTSQVVRDPLIFKGIRDKPLTNRPNEKEGSFEEQHADKGKEMVRTEEHIEDKYKKTTQTKIKMSWREYPEDAAVVLEGRRPEENEEFTQLKEGNSEIWTLTGASVMCDKEESPTWTEICKSGAVEAQAEDDAVFDEPLQGGPFELSMSQKQEIIGSVALDENTFDRKCENDLKTKVEGQQAESICEKDSEADMESHQPQRSSDTYQHTRLLMLSVTSQTSKPFGHFSWTESVTEGENMFFPALYKGFDVEKTFRQRATQESQDQLVGAKSPVESSRPTTLSVGSMLNWLLLWWVKFCSFSHISGALRYTVLVIIFIATYLHDLPVCLAIYVLSVCWWCRQSLKKRASTADSVD
ncbi:uncharacterized protein ppp1r3aa [Trichomycterus rosablanca]|uniref:uncharacterized protein ppp1r3aa n=1 Tax=Trichomycterus rosablanca TaxID=2290929 RepID=UPI002F35543E